MRKAARTYLKLALGVTDTSSKKVKKAVEDAVGKGGATADQIAALASDLMAAQSANRDAISKLVRFEVDRALGVVGLATADEVNELTARVRDLERQLREAETRSSTPGVAAGSATLPDASPSPVGPTAKAMAKKAMAKKATAKKATAKKATAKKATANVTDANQTDANQTDANQTAKRIVAADSARRTVSVETLPGGSAEENEAAPSKTAPRKTVARKTVASKTARKAQP
jgi:polyhydroxyalkanoate synthesis regulator phasin